jgi:hypothetical protein
MTKEKKNPILIYIISTLIVAVVCWHFYPQIKPLIVSKERQKFEKKIESVENYYDEAVAMSLSMPLLNDSIVNSYADSLLDVLVYFNLDWIIFVRTERGFENYTDEIKKLNEKVDKLRVEFELEITMRELRREMREMEQYEKRWEGTKKKSTEV